MIENPPLLGEVVVHERQSFRRVRQYYQGHHPLLGKLHEGWSGPETIVERDVIKAVGRFATSTPMGVSRATDMEIYNQAKWSKR